MRVLAVDTTTPRGSVAVVEGTQARGEVGLVVEDSHSRWLLGAIDFLLGSLELRPPDLDGFAVATGPGSFTGLRVGISTVQGLALASQRPCLGLSVLDALAAVIRGRASTLVAMMDAGRGEVCAAAYDGEGRLTRELGVGRVEALLNGLERGAAFVGDAVEGYRAEIEAQVRDPLFPPRPAFLAAEIGSLAGPRLAAGEGRGPEFLRPLYMREAQIRKSSS